MIIKFVFSSRKMFAILFILIFVHLEISAQTIIENSDKPLAKNAGRVLKLQEIWRITDEGGQLFLKYPRDLKVAQDGSIFLADQTQFLKFSAEGKFIKNLYKKGQGPGEIERYYTYHIYKNEIYIRDFNSGRFFKTDFDGNLIEQIKIEDRTYSNFSGVSENSLLFFKSLWPPPEDRKGKLMDIHYIVGLISKDGRKVREIANFPVKMFLGAKGNNMEWASFQKILSEDGKRLVVSHTREYLIEVLDFEKGQIVRRFNRNYPHVKYRKQGWEDDFRERNNTPEIQFEEDVKGLFCNKDRIWVKTSTNDKEKGNMFDVFDSEGRFVDSFYLSGGRTLLNPNGDTIFVLEKDKAENWLLIKYNIME